MNIVYQWFCFVYCILIGKWECFPNFSQFVWKKFRLCDGQKIGQVALSMVLILTNTAEWSNTKISRVSEIRLFYCELSLFVIDSAPLEAWCQKFLGYKVHPRWVCSRDHIFNSPWPGTSLGEHETRVGLHWWRRRAPILWAVLVPWEQQ